VRSSPLIATCRRGHARVVAVLLEFAKAKLLKLMALPKAR
jgi:hypothetical protein